MSRQNGALEVVYGSGAPFSFDFISWMFNMKCLQEQHGFPHLRVCFNEEEANTPLARQMLDNVMRPALPLFDAEECGSAHNMAIAPYTIYPTVDYFRTRQRLPLMVPSPTASQWAGQFGNGYYTITLREASYMPERNSDNAAWFAFARTLSGSAIILRDTNRAHDPIDGFVTCPEASISLDKRLALYGGARMNFFIANGPNVLALYTQTAPYLCFQKAPDGYMCLTPTFIERYLGIAHGGQFPWADPARQQMVWANDSLSNITAAWDTLQ